MDSSPSIFSTAARYGMDARDENAGAPRFREPRGTCSELGEVASRREGENQRADRLRLRNRTLPDVACANCMRTALVRAKVLI
jgi:hypothetical protein